MSKIGSGLVVPADFFEGFRLKIPKFFEVLFDGVAKTSMEVPFSTSDDFLGDSRFDTALVTFGAGAATFFLSSTRTTTALSIAAFDTFTAFAFENIRNSEFPLCFFSISILGFSSSLALGSGTSLRLSEMSFSFLELATLAFFKITSSSETHTGTWIGENGCITA